MANISVPIQINLPDDWLEQIIERLKNDPEAEWATVTRCKDCKYADEYFHCSYTTWWNSPNDFCSKAERREK